MENFAGKLQEIIQVLATVLVSLQNKHRSGTAENRAGLSSQVSRLKSQPRCASSGPRGALPSARGCQQIRGPRPDLLPPQASLGPLPRRSGRPGVSPRWSRTLPCFCKPLHRPRRPQPEGSGPARGRRQGQARSPATDPPSRQVEITTVIVFGFLES